MDGSSPEFTSCLNAIPDNVAHESDSSDDDGGDYSADAVNYASGGHNRYFKQCYKQPELLLPWDIGKPQPDIVALQKAQPDLFASPVLEVGAGFGDTLTWLSATLGLDVVACDVSAEALAEGQRRLAAATAAAAAAAAAAATEDAANTSSGSVRFVECDICNPQPGTLTDGGWFGTVVDSAVFHCIGGASQQLQYVETVTSVVRPSGHLIMLACSDRNLANDHPHMRQVSQKELHSYFNAESGWTVKEIQECRYCCVGRSLNGKPPHRFALKAWLMVACRLGNELMN